MASSLVAFLIAGLAAHNVFATPLPPPDCANDSPSSCTVDIYHHGGIPGNPLPPRDALPCPLEGDCGPLTVDPITVTPTSTLSGSLTSVTACTTPFPGVNIPLGCEEITSGPYAGQCISIECLDSPNTCGCPGAPPEPAQQKRSAASSDCGLDGGCSSIIVPPIILISTSTSTVTPPTPTCTPPHGAIPIGEECYTSGPNAGQCISIECLDRPNTCGCPGAPPPAARKEKRTVSPVSSSTSTMSLPSPTVCTEQTGPIPIGEECFTSGPHAGQCISFECLEHPDVCGCPGAPPPAPTKEKRSEDASSNCGLDGGCTPIAIIPAPTSTSSAPLPSATTCVVRDAGPIGSQCFTSGPHEGQCISFLCLDFPDTCGCPGGDVGKRGESAPTKRQFEGDHFIGGPGPVCVEPVCESCPDLPECASDVKRSPQEKCHLCGP